ncbi:MAG: DUF6580 family putative transport protein [Verrucomicrobiales bacterium]
MLPAIFLILAVVAFRLVPSGWENFSPMAAVFLCAAIYLPRKWALTLPLAAFLISDAALNVLRYDLPPVSSHTAVLLLGFGLVYLLGRAIRPRPRFASIFGGALAASFLFYALTSSAAWLSSPAYAKTFAGWVQCLTVGDPAFSPPAWVFFRNALLGDLAFTGLFVACMSFFRAPEASTTESSAHPAPLASHR